MSVLKVSLKGASAPSHFVDLEKSKVAGYIKVRSFIAVVV